MQEVQGCGVRAEELVSVKRSILDIVVVQQQKRIIELEEKLRKTKQEVVELQKQKQVNERTHSSCEQKVASTSVTPKIECTSVLPSRITTPSISDKPIAKGKCKSAPVKSPQLSILPRYWTEDEHRKFLEGRKQFGPKNYAAISALVGTRTPKQVRTHAQKYEMRLVRESAMRSFMGTRRTISAPSVVPGNELVLDSDELDMDVDGDRSPFDELQSAAEVPRAQNLEDLDSFIRDDFDDDLRKFDKFESLQA